MSKQDSQVMRPETVRRIGVRQVEQLRGFLSPISTHKELCLILRTKRFQLKFTPPGISSNRRPGEEWDTPQRMALRKPLHHVECRPRPQSHPVATQSKSLKVRTRQFLSIKSSSPIKLSLYRHFATSPYSANSNGLDHVTSVLGELNSKLSKKNWEPNVFWNQNRETTNDQRNNLFDSATLALMTTLSLRTSYQKFSGDPSWLGRIFVLVGGIFYSPVLILFP